jgi:hypothetical protein
VYIWLKNNIENKTSGKWLQSTLNKTALGLLVSLREIHFILVCVTKQTLQELSLLFITGLSFLSTVK